MRKAFTPLEIPGTNKRSAKFLTGFTLIELLIVIVIVGILASITIPNFTKTVEKAKADQAKTYLKVIRTGEKIYFTNNSTYVAAAGMADIRTKLGAEITEENYTFSIAGNPDIADSFLVTATRVSDSAKYITIDHDGTIVENWR